MNITHATKFNAAQLVQCWPVPSRPRPIVIIGAGDIVRDAHLPAYRKAGLPVAGAFDLRREVAEARAEAVADPAPVDPEVDALLAEKMGGAVQMVLDALAPAERAAFVLHDVFGYPFDEISAVMGRSGTAVRQLASRARRKVQGEPEPSASQAARAESQRVVDAFLTAARGGDLTTLLQLLAPDALMRADLVAQGMGTDPLYDGAAAVAARFDGARGAAPVTIDGDLGAAWIQAGTVKVAFVFHVGEGLVREVELIADPDVLATLDVARVRARS